MTETESTEQEEIKTEEANVSETENKTMIYLTENLKNVASSSLVSSLSVFSGNDRL